MKTNFFLMSDKVEVVEPYELAGWLEKDPKSVCIIDVRDHDYSGGLF
jgi:hypothetical protein